MIVFNATQIFYPYLFAGVSYLSFDPKNGNPPHLEINDRRYARNELNLNGEAGARLMINPELSLNLSFSFSGNFGDNLDGFSSAGYNYDFFYTINAGISYSIFNFQDSDKDGVSDVTDECSDTYRYIAVDEKGCPRDSDGDGLDDQVEAGLGTNRYSIDSDRDGITDFDEVTKFGSDPLDIDTDRDGLDDGEELIAFRTNMLMLDSDGDDISDGEEIHKYFTNPLNIDSDSDGINDDVELNFYRTDPLNPDSDGGNVNDGSEINRGSNPLYPNDDFPIKNYEIGRHVILEGITFESGSTDITGESEAVLFQVFYTLSSIPDIELEIQGYTDNTGSYSKNIDLSKKRAEAVKSWLVNLGIESSRLRCKGFGPANPIASNRTPKGREKNRRIEFVRTR